MTIRLKVPAGSLVRPGREEHAMTRRWTAADVPAQSGRTAIVTGASGGLGLETARVLAGRGAVVVLACRDEAKAARAAAWIRERAGRALEGTAAGERGPDMRVIRLDLASLACVREAAGEILEACPRIDLLINNAGVMAVPSQRSADGFELTLATNHLGHFALTGLLLARLQETPGSRVVTVSSIGHRMGPGVMHFDDLQYASDYDPWRAYWQSKLANLLFTYELAARLEAAGAGTAALAAHPGNARTELWRHSRVDRALYSPRLRMLTFWFAQSALTGALATLRAATDPAARGGEYYGPPGRLQYTGHPQLVESSPQSRDRDAQRRLWLESEELTGISYPVAASWETTGSSA
jgi:NAD(P)-dependent dehydrogenase (short-subunit alcohol dehydrogenase family)